MGDILAPWICEECKHAFAISIYFCGVVSCPYCRTKQSGRLQKNKKEKEMKVIMKSNLNQGVRCDSCALTYTVTDGCYFSDNGWCPYCGKKQEKEITTKERSKEMKEYKVTIKQEVETEIKIRTNSEDEAQEVVESLISDDKIQHLIDDEEDLLECDEWEVDNVEEA